MGWVGMYGLVRTVEFLEESQESIEDKADG